MGPLIEKTRYRVTHAGTTWEIDAFDGANAGLVIAKVELPSPDIPIAIPAWVGLEVTANPRYYNSNLLAYPFRDWF